MALMTKKQFKEQCNTDHVYGRGAKRINAIYFDWKETDQGRGFKYAVATRAVNYTKAELLNTMYDWVVNGIHLPFHVFSRFGQYDNQRFKVPISFNVNSWN